MRIDPLLTGRSDPDPEKPNATVPCAVKPLPRSPLLAGVIHQLLVSGFNQMATPILHLRCPHQPPWSRHLVLPRQLRYQLAQPTCPLSPMTMTWDKATRAASCTTFRLFCLTTAIRFDITILDLPDPPSFNGSTKSERRTFIR
ncbi:hypothetical protein H257_02298 [Aphanomyces astaci]|uniref:Uncharacterized protein n=1 Tax=Aphanomyces astaci TaxID=112090 RepID=W4H3G8_APHAT|nr:hypothetical protein H257_02298 [Aphanomyces astaci]ETV85693.1 hypothetical protein H257_02298 [Aphanomyces astaci]|eukprot:XP_009824165.1 hypothetical protein H257_02298 [Aphanomyces astaci]